MSAILWIRLFCVCRVSAEKVQTTVVCRQDCLCPFITDNNNSISNKPKTMMANSEFIETNSTKNKYFSHQFASGYTTIFSMQIRQIKFIFHGVDVSGLILWTVLSGDYVEIIDQEIIENAKSYKLSKINHLYVIQPAGMIISLEYLLMSVSRYTITRQRTMLSYLWRRARPSRPARQRLRTQ